MAHDSLWTNKIKNLSPIYRFVQYTKFKWRHFRLHKMGEGKALTFRFKIWIQENIKIYLANKFIVKNFGSDFLIAKYIDERFRHQKINIHSLYFYKSRCLFLWKLSITKNMPAKKYFTIYYKKFPQVVFSNLKSINTESI